jgi:Protein of unknown function (DUF2281)
MNIERAVVEKLKTLSTDKQQEVLDFVEFLQSKARGFDSEDRLDESVSFLEAAREFAGCLDEGPGDLATNKEYLEALGTE